jgi:hypothetical protein
VPISRPEMLPSTRLGLLEASAGRTRTVVFLPLLPCGFVQRCRCVYIVTLDAAERLDVPERLCILPND